MNTPYSRDFFDSVMETSTPSAEAIVPTLLEWIRPASFLDVGGGTGAWTAVFASRGVQNYLCVDGSYVDRKQLRIPEHRFLEVDLIKRFDLGRRFDLTLCAEVAEHLPASSAEGLVGSIVHHSDIVVFSAAVPKQGGTSHLNEQWPDYWAHLFFKHGFRCFDCIRPRFWEDESVAWWYRQNLLVFANQAGEQSLGRESEVVQRIVESPARLVHPEMFMGMARGVDARESLEEVPRLPWALRAISKSVRASVQHHARRLFSLNSQ